MKIIADEAIFRVEEYFAGLGELRLLPGRAITAEHVRDADILLVRTVTTVDRHLLAKAAVRFVGSATSGVDHIDRDWLATRGIGFFHAAGCNAEAVVNYVFAVLAWISSRTHQDWRRCGVGIIGAGNVGGRLARVLESLGMDFVVHDPFLASDHPLAAHLTSLEEAMARDVVSIHTPLTRGGPFPTWHMLDDELLAGMKQDAVLINAARGEVLDNTVLGDFHRRRPDVRLALDVWENEPAIDESLLPLVTVGTPHIAGYSMNGKRQATEWVYQACLAFFALPGQGRASAATREPLALSPAHASELDILNRAILTAYSIERDFITAHLAANTGGIASLFDGLRNQYRFRPEFRDYTFDDGRLPKALAAQLQALGFARRQDYWP